MITTKVVATDLEVGMFFELAGGMCRIVETTGLNAYGQTVIRFEVSGEDPNPDYTQTVVMTSTRVLDILEVGPDPTWTPGRWVQLRDPLGVLKCESSDEDECRGFMTPGDSLKRIFVSPQMSEWRDI